MYNKIEIYKDILKSGEQQYDAYIILQDGTKVDADISGFKVIYNLGEKIIGNFAARRVEFTLFNTSKYNITNQDFEVFVGLNINNQFDYISIGNFIANKPEIKNEALDECTICAQNYSLKFKIPYKPILVFPCTIDVAIKTIAEYLGILYTENDFINKNYILQEFYIDEDATFFDVIKTLVGAGFANADINNLNSLIVKSPKFVPEYKFDIQELFELKKEDNKYGPLNAIVASRIIADDGSTTEDVFSRDETSINENGKFEYKIIQNDAIDYDRQTAVDNILAGILNFQYNPAEIEAVYNPAIEIGDMLEVPDAKADTSFLLFAKEITADISTGLMTVSSTEDTQTETDYKAATVKDKRIKTGILVSKMEGKINLAVELSEEASAKATELELTSSEISSRVSETETLLAKDYMTKEEAATQYSQLSNSFKFNINNTIEELKEEGASKVMTTSVTIDDEGVTVGKSDSGFTNTMNNTGTYQYNAGELIAKYDKDGAEIPRLKSDYAVISDLKYVKEIIDGVVHHRTYVLE